MSAKINEFFAPQLFKKGNINTRIWKKDKKKLWRKCFGMVISVCKRFFLHRFTNTMHKSVYIWRYRTVKYGKMINTEAAQLYT